MRRVACIVAVLLMPGACGFGATAGAASPTEIRKWRLEIRKLERDLSGAELQRRKLALDRLGGETGLDGAIKSWATPFSVLLAVTAALAGAVKYWRERREAETARAEDLIDIERSRLLALLETGPAATATLDAALSRLAALQPRAAEPPETSAAISRILADLLLDAVDLDDVRHAGFAARTIEAWPDLKRHWRTHRHETQRALAVHGRALKRLGAGRARALAHLALEGTDVTRHSDFDEDQFARLQALLLGYRRLALLLPVSLRAAAIEDLGGLLGNAAFAHAWLSAEPS